MKREQFLARLRRYCRKNGLDMQSVEWRGKGSHITVYVGDARTVVQSGELRPSVVENILKQLGLPPNALN